MATGNSSLPIHAMNTASFKSPQPFVRERLICDTNATDPAYVQSRALLTACNPHHDSSICSRVARQRIGRFGGLRVPPALFGRVFDPGIGHGGKWVNHAKRKQTMPKANNSGGQLFPECIPVGINSEAWAKWVAYRKAKRKRVSALAEQLQWEVLLMLTPDQQAACIDSSIRNDYTGLFPQHFSGPPKKGDLRSRTLEQDLTDRSWAD